jgi:hypothetical protein
VAAPAFPPMPRYHVAIEELQDWAYTGKRLVPLQAYPGVVWERPKSRGRPRNIDDLEFYGHARTGHAGRGSSNEGICLGPPPTSSRNQCGSGFELRRPGLCETRTLRWREVDSNYRFPNAPVMPRELESRELLMRTPQTRSATRSWKSRAEQKVRRLTEGDGFEPSVPRRHLGALPADPSGPALRSPPTRRTAPTASSPRSTTAATWSGRRSA